ncbi:MAG: C69 family dipeptidase [Actinomycetaceae bacterium]|nr:C69 family dipeptidase [Actinomycetaceae bacterium]
MKLQTRASVFITAVFATMALALPAHACTGIIIGQDLTTDGSAIFGRTEDLEQNHPKRLLVHEAGKYQVGASIEGVNTGVAHIQTKPSLKFTSVSDVTPEDGDFDEAGFNSAGVAVDATISAGVSEAIEKIDPYTEKGWEEGVLTTVLLANATTAREGVELMAKLVDKDGMNEGDTLIIADQKEIWYMELYSGHQYAAMKYPSDKFSIMPNAFWLNKVNCADKTNFVCSVKLEQVPREAGTYKETNGSFDPAASYNPTEASERNSSRMWSGVKTLDPGSTLTSDSKEFPFLNTPSAQFKKVSVADAMRVQRSRFEGVDPNLAALSQKVVKDTGFLGADNKPVAGAQYPIGNTNTMEAHIFQLPAKGMPATVPGTLWQTVGNPQSAPYLPYYGNVTSFIAPYQTVSIADRLPKGNNPRQPFMVDDSSYYWLATEVGHAIEKDRATLAAPVMNYLNRFEASLMAKRPTDDQTLATKQATNPGEAAAWATNDFAVVSTNAFEDLKGLKATLRVYNTTHRLPGANGNYLTVGPKQIVLPTIFAANEIGAAQFPALDAQAQKAGKVRAAWNLGLAERIPGGAGVQYVQPNGAVSVSLKVPAGVRLSRATLFQEQNSTWQPVKYTVKGRTITFRTTTLGQFALVRA